MSDLGPPLPPSLPRPTPTTATPAEGTPARPGPTAAPSSPSPPPAGPPAAATPPSGPPANTALSAAARAALQAYADQAPAPAPTPAAPQEPPPAPASPSAPPADPGPSLAARHAATAALPGMSLALVETIAAATGLTPRAARAWLDALGLAHQAARAHRDALGASAPELAEEHTQAATAWSARAQDAVRRLLRLGVLGRKASEGDLERVLRRWLGRSSDRVPIAVQLAMVEEVTSGLEAAAVARGAALADLQDLRGLDQQPHSLGLFQARGPMARGLLNLALFLLPAVALGVAWLLMRQP